MLLGHLGRHDCEKRNIGFMECRSGLCSFVLSEGDALLATVSLQLCGVGLVGLVGLFHIGGMECGGIVG